jgi:hypothetical protein
MIGRQAFALATMTAELEAERQRREELERLVTHLSERDPLILAQPPEPVGADLLADPEPAG